MISASGAAGGLRGRDGHTRRIPGFGYGRLIGRCSVQLGSGQTREIGLGGVLLDHAAFHDAVTYAHERVQFSIPIAEQPLVKSMLAKMAV